MGKQRRVKTKTPRKLKSGVKESSREVRKGLQKRYGTTTKKKADKALKKRNKSNARSK